MSATMLATVGVIVAMLATAEAKAVGAVPHMDTTGCSLVLRPGPLMDREPLFLQPGGSLNVFGFVDADAKGLVTLAKGQQVLMACPGSLVGNLKEELLAECDSDTNFIIDGKSTALTDLNCNKHPDYLDEATGGSCGAGGRATHAVIGHRTAAGIVQIMEVRYAGENGDGGNWDIADIANIDDIAGGFGIVGDVRNIKGNSYVGRKRSLSDIWDLTKVRDVESIGDVGYLGSMRSIGEVRDVLDVGMRVGDVRVVGVENRSNGGGVEQSRRRRKKVSGLRRALALATLAAVAVALKALRRELDR